MKPQHLSTFDGESDYRTAGKRYSIRWREPKTTTPAATAEATRLVGCIYSRDGGFPPAEVVQHFDGYTPAAYVRTGDRYDVETSNGTISVPVCEWQFQGVPETVPTVHGLWARTHWDDCQAVGCAPAALTIGE